MDFEDTVIESDSIISQTKKERYCIVSLMWNLNKKEKRKSQTHRNSRIKVARSLVLEEIRRYWSKSTSLQL